MSDSYTHTPWTLVDVVSLITPSRACPRACFLCCVYSQFRGPAQPFRGYVCRRKRWHRWCFMYSCIVHVMVHVVVWCQPVLGSPVHRFLLPRSREDSTATAGAGDAVAQPSSTLPDPQFTMERGKPNKPQSGARVRAGRGDYTSQASKESCKRELTTHSDHPCFCFRRLPHDFRLLLFVTAFETSPSKLARISSLHVRRKCRRVSFLLLLFPKHFVPLP